jgi:glycosyltransferase involved in cell wall biosynthesis
MPTGDVSPTQKKPLISCLMVSRGNLFPARFAVECYQRQTYEERELVIVCAQPDSALAAWIAKLGDPSIRYIETQPAVLGALRNISVAAARGELLCTWDDDDLYHSRRLELQSTILEKRGAGAHFLSHLLLWWPARRQFSISHKRTWEPSLLVRRELLTKYPEIPLKEDTHVVAQICKRHQIALTRAPRAYCYIVHGANSCHQSHFEAMFRHASQKLPGTDYEKELKRLSADMPIKRYASHLPATNVYTLLGEES